jgi:NTP pyrophosphatase (non-canonical NTP hydrolase)
MNAMDANTTIETLKQLIRDFVHDRAWEQFHNPKDLALSISVEAAELLELFQWQSADAITDALKDPTFRERIGEELADVVIYALSLANALNLDLSTSVTAKIGANVSKYPVSEYYGVYEKR